MKREERITKPDQYTEIYNKGSSYVDYYLVLKLMPNQLKISRYGISVSKRIGNAVVRNRVKRLLREILRVTPLNPGWDIILIARSPASGADYHRMQQSVNILLSRAGIMA
jgi:ribonuclease P protein component